jgi:hypothetical protein
LKKQRQASHPPNAEVQVKCNAVHFAFRKWLQCYQIYIPDEIATAIRKVNVVVKRAYIFKAFGRLCNHHEANYTGLPLAAFVLTFLEAVDFIVMDFESIALPIERSH